MPTPNPKRLLAFGITLITLLVLSATLSVLHELNELEDQFQSVVSDRNKRMELAVRMRHSSKERSILLHAMLATEDPFERDDTFMALRSLGEEFLSARASLMAMDLNQEELALLEKQRAYSSMAGRLQYKVIELLNSDQHDAAIHTLMKEAIPAQNRAISIIDRFFDLQNTYNQKALEQASSQLSTNSRITAMIGISITALSLLIGIYMYRRVSSMIDIQTRNRLELESLNAELSDRENRERAIRENVLDGIITTDAHGVIQSCNPAAEKMFGYEPGELTNQPTTLLMPEDERQEHPKHVDRYLESGRKKIIGMDRDVMGQRKNGEQFPLNIGVTEILSGGERLFIAALRDVSKQRAAELVLKRSQAELEDLVSRRTHELNETNDRLREEIRKHHRTQEQLAHLANHDHLTQLPNRSLFTEHLKMTLAQADRRELQTALLFIDLDGFKEVNDQHDHDTGDRLLCAVAGRLQKITRDEDLVARIGGDEFTLILANETDIRDRAETVATKIIEALASPFLIQGAELSIGASVGISIYPLDAHDIEEIQRHADHAMYIAKHQGKNRFVVARPSPPNAQAG